jgi:hypothetical protein
MTNVWESAFENQFVAAIQTLGDAIRNCPPELWEASLWTEGETSASQWPAYWTVAFHVLFYLDLYLEGTLDGFAPPAPFTLEELEPNGATSPVVYTQAQLLSYLDHCLRKCREVFKTMTEEKAEHLCKFLWMELDYANLLLDNMRHVQEHAAQLNMFLGQQARIRARWYSGKKKNGPSLA